jgi:IclR family pca regulon transcriptional regulator
MVDGQPARTSDHVQSLGRGLAVIRAFDAEHPELTLSDVARATGLTRAAARRFLLTLVELGYMRTDGRLFALRPRILELGYAYLSSLTLPEVAAPHLEALVALVRESSSVSVLDGVDVVYVARVPTKRIMAVLDGDDVVYVARIPTSRIMAVSINVGTRFPAYATSMGRVLLAGRDPDRLAEHLGTAQLRQITSYTVVDPARLAAEIARVREQGYAIVDQELEEGLRSIAAPIRNPAGEVVAAVNVSAHASRGTVTSLRTDLLPHLLRTAAAITADLSLGPR